MRDGESDFQDEMLAMGQRASATDHQVAAAMSAAGFSRSEIVDLLATSPWAAYHREFTRTHALPCGPSTAAALRRSFDAGEGEQAALARALAACVASDEKPSGAAEA